MSGSSVSLTSFYRVANVYKKWQNCKYKSSFASSLVVPDLPVSPRELFLLMNERELVDVPYECYRIVP